jgi:predicted Zn-dependent protease
VERGVEYFHAAIHLEPRSAGLHLGLGNALLRGGKAAEAVTEFNAALTLKPDLRQAYTQLARAYRTLGKLHEAQEALRSSNKLSEQEMRSVESSSPEEQLVSLPPDRHPNSQRPDPDQ